MRDVVYLKENCGYEKMQQFGFAASNLFPGYDGVARELEEDARCYKLKAELSKSN